jgi:hypothetical protein
MKNMATRKKLRRSLQWVFALVALASLLTLPKAAAAEPINGWFGEYYGNPYLSGSPVLLRNDEVIDFYWGLGTPATGLPADRFSVRWSRFAFLTGGTYRFFATSDDGVRVWLDGEIIIDQWHPAPGVTYVAERTLGTGVHYLRVEYYEEGGGAQMRFWWEGYTPVYYPDWKGEYYANQSLDGSPVLVRNDEIIDFDWDDAAPAESLPVDNFSVRWTQDIHFKTAMYRFYAKGDGYICVWVDGKLVLDGRLDGSIRDISADYTLSRGEHDIKVEYFAGGGDARVKVWWEFAPVYPDWKGEYWDNRYFRGEPVMIRNDDCPVFDWGTGSPAAELPADGFSVRWTRTEEFEAGKYNFYVRADDGFRVYVDGVQMLNQWHDSAGDDLFVASGTLSGEHTVVVEYYEHKGEAQMQFYWVRTGNSIND